MKMVKIVLIGFITTILRAMIQILMPLGQQTVLKPSIFIDNGSMPIVFMLYGTFAYTLIALTFLIIHSNMNGNRIIKGLKFGISCSLLWSIYLLEPLPHAETIDFLYPIADSAVLIVMGVLLGRFISISSYSVKKYEVTRYSLINIGLITILFFVGRMIQYKIFNIYSMFAKSPVNTIQWVIGTGIVIGLLFNYINLLIENKSIIIKSILFGVVIFGVDLFAFNFFVPIVFSFDILDLFIRTIVDIFFVSIGCYIINRSKSRLTKFNKIKI